MQWLAVGGEICLVVALSLCVRLSWRLGMQNQRQQWPFLLLALALGFIALNAAAGALRYSAFTPIIPLHGALTAISVALMMPLYVGALLRLWGHLPPVALSCWLAFALLPAIGQWTGLLQVPRILTDAMLVLGLLRVISQVQQRVGWITALFALLAVPLCGLLPLSADAGLGLFHLLLALHFYLIHQVMARGVALRRPVPAGAV